MAGLDYWCFKAGKLAVAGVGSLTVIVFPFFNVVDHPDQFWEGRPTVAELNVLIAMTIAHIDKDIKPRFLSVEDKLDMASKEQSPNVLDEVNAKHSIPQ